GIDESQCFELEINECNENEYRCHNGLCIPKQFWNDEFDEAECFDKSDLLNIPDCPDIYLQLYIFGCAEYACRPDEGQFPCGDGQCVEDFANQVGDRIIDCLGASDELEYCRTNYGDLQAYGFYCQNDRTCIEHEKLCDGIKDCLLGEDEKFCDDRPQLCEESDFNYLTDVEYVLCQSGSIHRTSFSLKTSSIYPPSPVVQMDSVNNQWNERHMKSSLDDFPRSEICNYGLHGYHWLGPGNTSDIDVSYYLAVLQQTESLNISTTIGPSQRCVPCQELFSSKLLALPRIHRLKSYHLPCQNNVDLQCFIDESTFVCQDNVYCENDGICLQDRPTCPESILCVCADCFFGDRCQFYAKGIGLTLDDILRYTIRPNLTFNDQSIVIKLSSALIMIIFIAGLLNSLLAYLAFHHQNSRQLGSGMYLHLSSIVSGLVVNTKNIS
ncbi:unnamed protein product, partial [Rotaria sordida]